MITDEFILLRGIPGSGKTTWRRARFSCDDVVSLDTIRGLICGDQASQKHNELAVEIQDKVLRVRCAERVRTVIDATNIPNQRVADLLTLANQHDMFTVAVVFDTPANIAIARNAARERPVPDHAMAAMIRAWEKNVPPTGPIPGFAVTRRILHPRWGAVFGDIPAQYAGAPWLR